MIHRRIDAAIERRLPESLRELERLIAVPSIAAQGKSLDEGSSLVAEMFRRRGFSVDILPTPGAPVVVAERAGDESRKLLFYNHYDVQPPEPLELWESPPFEPVVRDGKLFGRGASDDKGHLVARLLALDALLEVLGEPPCTLKWVVEGEEEIGSLHLPEFVQRERRRLAADACVWEFGYVDHRDVPIQMAGLRGICYVELSVRTAELDVHSGLGGSIFPNAAWRLTWALSTLKGPDERIRIPGFYDAVRPPTALDRELMAALPDAAAEYRSRYGVSGFLGGLKGGVELRLAEVMEPTCTICGLTSGYQGTGSKTVLPAQASAKVDFRLVPDQTPDTVLRGLRAHLDAHGFADVAIECLGAEPPARTDLDDPFLKLVIETAEPVYGAPMLLVPMSGGSGPNHAFVHGLGLPVATAGLGYPDSRVHAPNENVRLDLYVKHAKHIARVIEAFACCSPSRSSTPA